MDTTEMALGTCDGGGGRMLLSDHTAEKGSSPCILHSSQGLGGLGWCDPDPCCTFCQSAVRGGAGVWASLLAATTGDAGPLAAVVDGGGSTLSTTSLCWFAAMKAAEISAWVKPLEDKNARCA